MYEDTEFIEKLEDLYKLKLRQFVTSESTGHRLPMSRVLAGHHQYQLGQLKLRKLKRNRAATRSNSVAPDNALTTTSSNNAVRPTKPNTSRDLAGHHQYKLGQVKLRKPKRKRAAKRSNSVAPAIAVTTTSSNNVVRPTKSAKTAQSTRQSRTKGIVMWSVLGGVCLRVLRGFVGCVSCCVQTGRDH